MARPIHAHVRSHPLCSSTPRLTPTTQSPYPVSRASRGWLTHTCASANLPQPCRAYPFAVHPYPCPPSSEHLSRARLASWTHTSIPTPPATLPPHRTAFENNAASPTPHAPRSSVFVPSSSAGVAAPCRFSTADHRDPASMQAQANNAIDAYLPPSGTLQNLSWSIALVMLCRFCVRAACVVGD
jgi:hypothetical protein